MYTLARQHFDIDDLYKEIKQEIDNTHEFIETVQQRKLNETATMIAKWGIPIATFALIASIFGMNAKDFRFLYWFELLRTKPWPGYQPEMTSLSLLTLLLIGFVITLIVTFFFLKRLKRKVSV